MRPRTLRILYALALSAFGAMVPYLAVALADAGLGASAVALVLAGLPLGRLASGPVWAWAADRFRLSGHLLAVAALLAAGGVVLTGLGRAPAAALGMFLFSLGSSAVGPLLDGLAIASPAVSGRGYGRVRALGSAGFLVATLVSGVLQQVWGISPFWLGTACLLAFAAAALRVRDARPAPREPVLPAVLALLRRPGTAAFLLALLLHLAAHAANDVYLAVRVQDLGLPVTVVSVAVSLGVAVEIAVMWGSPVWLARWDPGRIALVGIAVAVLRWALVAACPHPVSLVAVQALHGITFGAFWVAATAWMAARSSVNIAASAQNVLYVVGWGVGGGIGIPLAGLFAGAFGSAALYGVLAAGSAVAAVAAAVSVLRREGAA